MATHKTPEDLDKELQQAPLITRERLQQLMEEEGVTADDLADVIKAVRAATVRRKTP